jgi:hypothetical protein
MMKITASASASACAETTRHVFCGAEFKAVAGRHGLQQLADRGGIDLHPPSGRVTFALMASRFRVALVDLGLVLTRPSGPDAPR